MSKPLVLTCDIGTQSARALLVDQDGTVLDMHQIKYAEPYFSKKPGWAEQKTDFYYAHLCAATRVLTDRNADKLGDVIAVTVTVIRDTLVFLDGDNRPTRDIMHWLDAREAKFDDPYPWWKTVAFALAGMGKAVKLAYRTSGVNWIRQNEPEVWEKTKKVVCLPAYLNFRLTGNLTDSVANTIAHIPVDFKGKCWMSKNNLTRCFYDVPQEKLYDLTESGAVLGSITHEASELSGMPEGLPLIATGSDKGCETLGLSVADEDKAAVSFGTTATIQLSTKKYFEPQQFLPSYPAVLNDRWNPEIQIYRGFWLLSWFVKEFGEKDRIEAEALGMSPEALLDKRAAEVPAGCNGLMLQPYWTPGVIKPDSFGAIIGYTDTHTRYHLYRAIIEGINLELYMSLKIMEKRSGMNIKEIFVGGGGAKSDISCQICADVFGLPVKRIQTAEACSVGASMVAFVAKGIFKDYNEAMKSMVHEKDVFMPDAGNHAIYMDMYEQVYRRIYGKLRPLYAKLNLVKEREGL